ncbi:hypothetical protein DPEC_G00354010 [Dallia pectoralis]|uniref:Uncharacterized protein n=1 Tax=Dallia pectoralis TaxID=75939 RepID=A0ACC2F2W0_DALPE|nr:hypothetical protein DPEC_G00354010 [Dallia pectoralis]
MSSGEGIEEAAKDPGDIAAFIQSDSLSLSKCESKLDGSDEQAVPPAGLERGTVQVQGPPANGCACNGIMFTLLETVLGLPSDHMASGQDEFTLQGIVGDITLSSPAQ